MTEVLSAAPSTPSRELVGIFSRPEPLLACITDLQAAGFVHADLSVLATHDAIEAAVEDGGSWQQRLMPLLSEARYEVPLVSGMLIALAGGPAAALIGGVAAAGVGMMAIKELVEEAISLPNSDAFAEAVRCGEILLWVVVADDLAEQKARSLFEQHGATNLHITARD